MTKNEKYSKRMYLADKIKEIFKVNSINELTEEQTKYLIQILKGE